MRREQPCITCTEHPRIFRQSDVAGYWIPRGITEEVDRKFREWCHRRDLHPEELSEGLTAWGRGK